MATRKSISEEWREKGNNSYQGVTDGLSPALQVTRLQEAINCYDRALSTAADRNEKSSACKNIAMANWKMAKAQAASDRPSNVSFYYKEALKHFQDGKAYGSGRDAKWHDSLRDAALRCWFDVSERLDEWEDEVRVQEMHQLVPYILDDVTKAREYLEIGNHYFNWSLTALSDRDFKQCLTLLKECHFPLKEAQRVGHLDPNLARECVVLEEDIYTHMCVAESIQERIKGELMLSHVIRDEEFLNIDMVWEVADLFRSAALLAKGSNREVEAMALSALGRVYDKVLKLKSLAKTCMTNVLELAIAMAPRNFTGEEWYDVARSTLEPYQQETMWAKKEQKEKKEVLKLIKDKLDTLKKKHQDLSKLEFLKFVYTTHPPKNSQDELVEVSATPEHSELEKLYKEAVGHYHPDKKHDKEWKVLSEEITKLLSQHYESLKSCD